MNFDKQTLSDLELFSRDKNKQSIFEIYNQTVTVGGRKKLYQYFQYPISNIQFLNERKNEIKFFHTHKIRLKLNKRQIDFVEYYRNNGRSPLKANWIDAYKEVLLYQINHNGDYYNIREGIFYLVNLLADIARFLKEVQEHDIPDSLTSKLEFCKTFIELKGVQKFVGKVPKSSKAISAINLGRLDNLFRAKEKQLLEDVLDSIYLIDTLQGLALMVDGGDFSLPKYESKGKATFEVEDCFHPFLANPIRNSYKLNSKGNLCFLTGPNMSGKSTFLKSIGLLVYLSHLGFPVPAKKMVLSVQNCLFTTINLADDLNLGISHFYSEVKRVKEMALELESQKHMFVIFDELFKGTNVKDAYDATLMVVKALSKIRNSIFFISSHILEVAERLSETENVDFKCFESVLHEDIARYDYKLKEGISTERVGFQIVKRENIEKILHEIIKKEN